MEFSCVGNCACETTYGWKNYLQGVGTEICEQKAFNGTEQVISSITRSCHVDGVSHTLETVASKILGFGLTTASALSNKVIVPVSTLVSNMCSVVPSWVKVATCAATGFSLGASGISHVYNGNIKKGLLQLAGAGVSWAVVYNTTL